MSRAEALQIVIEMALGNPGMFSRETRTEALQIMEDVRAKWEAAE